MRPRSIVLFERVYWLNILFAAGWLAWFYIGQGHAMRAISPNTPAEMRHVLPWIRGALPVASIGIALLLCYFIARRGSNVAKWIFVFFFAVSLLSVAVTALIYARGTGSVLMLGASGFGMALRLICMVLLFQPDSTRWFRGRHSPDDLLKTFS